MSITYEEALSTLESMFGAPWDRDVLDAILRHFQGHMENTVEAILAHGEQAPALLVQTLRQTKTAPTSSHAGAATTQTPNREAQDSMLAQQLAAEERHQQAAQQQQQQQQQLQQSQKRPAGRGLPTDLPSDFLRIPGYTVSASSTTSSIMDQDEALARMLQDELFSQELANNPEFAHLVNGRAGAGSRNQRTTPVPRGSHMQYPSRTNTAATTTNAATGPPIMDHIAELGQDAKKRLQLFAAQWNNGVNQIASRFAGNASSATAGTTSGGITQNTAVANETRGLLDSHDNDDGEEMEMSFTPTNSTSTKTKHQ